MPAMTPNQDRLPGATCPQISTVQLCLRTVRREMGEALNLASCEALDRADAELDSLREANAALRVAAEGRAWQPIETAPMDGKEVLVFTAQRVVRLAFFDVPLGGVWSSWPGRNRYEPTHWQPLPPAPTSPSAKR